MLAAGVYPAGDRMENHVDADVMAKLRERMKSHNFPAAGLSRLKPWAALLLLVALELKQAGFDAESGNQVFRKSSTK